MLRYAVATGRAERDVTNDLPRDILTAVTVEHHAAITNAAQFGELLRLLDKERGQPSVRLYLRILARVFTRPGELRLAEWPEFDVHAAQWTVPAARMKMRREHIVPLSRQLIAQLAELRELTGNQQYLFHSYARANRRHVQPISDSLPSVALKALGVSADVHTAHGFRSSACSLLHELGHDSQLIGLALAHRDTNAVRAIYNRSERPRRASRADASMGRLLRSAACGDREYRTTNRVESSYPPWISRA